MRLRARGDAKLAKTWPMRQRAITMYSQTDEPEMLKVLDIDRNRWTRTKNLQETPEEVTTFTSASEGIKKLIIQ